LLLLIPKYAPGFIIKLVELRANQINTGVRKSGRREIGINVIDHGQIEFAGFFLGEAASTFRGR
jgi:hypothetical protein